MITFVSTFPPIVCGIGTYLQYLLTHMPNSHWRVISFSKDEFLTSDEALPADMKPRVDYRLSVPYSELPWVSRKDLLWFQHSFGMWGKDNDYFISLLQQSKRRGNKVAVSLHTVHFQSEETHWGVRRREEELLRAALPLVDVLTVFTDGAYRAVTDAFPEYSEKVVVLRHGVHLHPEADSRGARKKFLHYLINEAAIPSNQKRELNEAEASFHSSASILIGNYGFISRDKAALRLYELGRLIQEKLPRHLVITIYAGIVQRRKDSETHLKNIHELESLKSCHNGKNSFFFELYIPEDLFPLAFRALDFAVFWCDNATQSGRLAHAQGAGVFVAGRDCEGIGETLRLSGLPAAVSLDELAETIGQLVLEPGLRNTMRDRSWQYAMRFSYANQSEKHLMIENALARGLPLPTLDLGKAAQSITREEKAGTTQQLDGLSFTTPVAS